jgi:hypothetical protein
MLSALCVSHSHHDSFVGLDVGAGPLVVAVEIVFIPSRDVV